MVYVQGKTENQLQEEWKSKNGHYPTAVENTFGQIEHYFHWAHLDAWCIFIHQIFGNWWPIDVVGGWLMDIVKLIYGLTYYGAYDGGVQKAIQLETGLKQLLDDYTAKFNNAISQLNTVKNDAETWIADHEKRLKALEQKLGMIPQMPAFITNLKI